MPLDAALGRVLARDIVASVDVPGFDRSNVDGFAIAGERHVRRDGGAAAQRAAQRRSARARRRAATETVVAGRATPIATGGMLPRGADAVLMVEHSEVVDGDGATTRDPPAGDAPART